MPDEKTSPRLASLAAKAMREPESLSLDEIRALGGSALTQAPDREPLPSDTPPDP